MKLGVVGAQMLFGGGRLHSTFFIVLSFSLHSVFLLFFTFRLHSRFILVLASCGFRLFVFLEITFIPSAASVASSFTQTAPTLTASSRRGAPTLTASSRRGKGPLGGNGGSKKAKG